LISHADQLVCNFEIRLGTDPGSDPGTDPGSDPGLDPGSDPGSDQPAELHFCEKFDFSRLNTTFFYQVEFSRLKSNFFQFQIFSIFF